MLSAGLHDRLVECHPQCGLVECCLQGCRTDWLSVVRMDADGAAHMVRYGTGAGQAFLGLKFAIVGFLGCVKLEHSGHHFGGDDDIKGLGVV